MLFVSIFEIFHFAQMCLHDSIAPDRLLCPVALSNQQSIAAETIPASLLMGLAAKWSVLVIRQQL